MDQEKKQQLGSEAALPHKLVTCQLEVENLYRQTHNAASEIELLHLVLSNHIFASF